MSALDHIGINAIDYEKSKAFYVAALAPLGISVLSDFGFACGFGADRPFLWLAATEKPVEGAEFGTGKPGHMHIALSAPDHATVDAFYAAALAAGGTDNGKPGLRPEYHETYYGAFVLDPDGHNIEAVCHVPA